MDDIKRYFPLLLNSSLFRGIDEQELETLLRTAGYTLSELPGGTYVFRENDLVRKLGIVLEGELFAIKGYPDGRESILDILLSPKIFALDIALTPTGAAAFSVLASLHSKVLTIPFEWADFTGRLEPDAGSVLIRNIVAYIADENIRKQRKIEIISQKGLRGRICSYLEIMRRRRGDTFSLPYTREQLADYLCVNRSALSHELSLMKRDGLIDFKLNRFTLLRDLDRL